MGALWTILGIFVICGTLREIFRDLFRPSGSGALSSFIGSMLFRLGQRLQWMLPIAGPLTIAVVIGVWSALLTVGFGLIYWPYFPHHFLQPVPEPASWEGRFWSVAYFSLVSLTTLSAGALTPQGPWLRMCAAIESLIGIGLVTASVTWIVLIYPALGRMRAIARRVWVLKRAREQMGIGPLAAMSESLLRDFAQRVVRLRVDFIHFPLIYYFHSDTEGASLSRALRTLLELAKGEKVNGNDQGTRLAAAMLETALNDLAEIFTVKFIRDIDPKHPEKVFQAVGEDHLRHSAEESAG